MTIIQFSAAVRRIQPAYALATTTHTPNLTTAIPDWRDARSADGCRPRGVSTYVDKFEQFVVFAGDIPANQITADLVESYKLHLHKRGLEPSTVRHALTVVRVLCLVPDEGVLGRKRSTGGKTPEGGAARPRSAHTRADRPAPGGL